MVSHCPWALGMTSAASRWTSRRGSRGGGGLPGRQVAGEHVLLLDDRDCEHDPSFEDGLDRHSRVGHDDDAVVRGITIVLPRHQVPSLAGVGYMLDELGRAHCGDL